MVMADLKNDVSHSETLDSSERERFSRVPQAWEHDLQPKPQTPYLSEANETLRRLIAEGTLDNLSAKVHVNAFSLLWPAC